MYYTEKGGAWSRVCLAMCVFDSSLQIPEEMYGLLEMKQMLLNLFSLVLYVLFTVYFGALAYINSMGSSPKLGLAIFGSTMCFVCLWRAVQTVSRMYRRMLYSKRSAQEDSDGQE